MNLFIRILIHRLKIAGALLISGLLSLSSSAQTETKYLSLKEATDAVSTNNPAIQSARLDETIAGEKYKQTSAAFLPLINFSYSALVSDNPLNAFGFKLQQRNVTPKDFDPQVLNDPSTTSDFTTKFEIQQPVYNADAALMRKSARMQTEIYKLKTQRTREYLVMETEKAYYQLQFAHCAVIVFEEALNTSKAVYQFTTDRAEQGLIQKSDVLNAEVQVLSFETGLNEAKLNLLNASDYLSVLMNKPTGVVYETEEMNVDSSQENISQTIPNNRSDFLAIDKTIKATSLMEKSYKMKYLPRLNAFGSYQFNDKAIAGFGANSYLAGLQLSWNIFDGSNNKRQIAGLKLEQQKLGVQLQSMKQENSMQLEKANRDLASSLFKIRQQNAAVIQAEEALRILQNRFQEGLVNTTDVLQSQTQLSQQKLALLQAVFYNHVTRAYIRFLITGINQQ